MKIGDIVTIRRNDGKQGVDFVKITDIDVHWEGTTFWDAETLTTKTTYEPMQYICFDHEHFSGWCFESAIVQNYGGKNNG